MKKVGSELLLMLYRTGKARYSEIVRRVCSATGKPKQQVDNGLGYLIKTGLATRRNAIYTLTKSGRELVEACGNDAELLNRINGQLNATWNRLFASSRTSRLAAQAFRPGLVDISGRGALLGNAASSFRPEGHGR